MRELQDFSSWADSIIQESIMEKTQNTPDRAIPIEKNIMYQAQRKYRDLDPEQALNLFLADKLDDFDRRDLDQNKVINRQRQENEKLRGQVTQISQELQDIEAHSAEADKELDRIKQLGGKLQTDVETRRVGAREVQEIMAQVEALKNKEGMDPRQFEQLKSQVEDQIKDFRTKGVNPEKFAELSQRLDAMTQADQVDRDELARVQDLIGKVEAGQREIETGKTDIAAKLADLEKRQDDIEQREKNIDKEIDAKVVQAAVRAGRRGTQAEYKRSKERLNRLEDEVLPDIVASLEDSNREMQKAVTSIKDNDTVQDIRIQKIEQNIPAAVGATRNVKDPGAMQQADAALKARLARLGKIQPASVPGVSPEQAPNLELTTEGLELQETDAETRKIAFMYAQKFADVYYEEFWLDANKRPIMQRYGKTDVMSAIFQSLYNWLFRIGTYAIEESEYDRIWNTALEILVAQHPYIDYEDLGIDPNKIKGQTFVRPKTYGGKSRTVTRKPEPEQLDLPLDYDRIRDVKESRLPKKYTQAIDDMAAQILGDQYGKYLR